MEGIEQPPCYDDGVAFLIVTTPVPPMPLVILRESQGDNHHTNSYDLLQTVIRQSRQRSDGMNRAELETLRRTKLDAYERMWQGIKAVDIGAQSPTDPPCEWSGEALQRCYEVFQEYFRSMVQIYTLSGGTPDLRFLPLDFLTGADPITRKTRDHLKALSDVWDSLDDSLYNSSGPNLRTNPRTNRMNIKFTREALDNIPYPQLVGMYAHKIRLNDVE
jgi:hypothetical protein